ncbi:hypothetical protein HN784_03700 [bacterium]|jgi:hypothetical protein|nr:hypothetical protein [bacterium]MBT4251100.1 hypothetical protein [bacterium]MBT4598108.1 hypothetical protein [bacterium]MBT6753450.1 hypothetical protein [bacterium]MBT7038163.1 hypothetical protein [bacterium]
MELKEYLKVLKKYKTTFVVIWVGAIAFGLIAASLVPQRYKTTFSIDITRDTQEEGTQEYDFDQFYRLEADDRFGRTIVEWFSDGAIVNNIHAVARSVEENFENEELETKFKAKKLANSYLRVSFLVSEKKEVKPLFLGVKKVLNEKTKEFNGGFNKQSSFKLIFNGPTIANATIPLTPLLISLIGSGFFLAAFGIMFRKYLE